MKSAHRHELETNVLAHRLEDYIERSKPYIPKVLAGLAALIVLMFLWSYISNSAASSQNEAWDTFNYAVGAQPMNMELLHQAADAFPGTQMQELADVTWADGQAMIASNSYIYNRTLANKSLEQAATAYKKVIDSSGDAQLKSRAHLGLGRVYEMQNDLDQARKQYELVTGAYSAYAKTQAERLAKPEAKETYAWLATAEPPRPKTPMGPGTPGQKLDFSPGEMNLPAGPEADAAKSGTTQSAADVFNKLLNDAQEKAKPAEGDRYKDAPPATDATPAAPATGEAAKDAAAPATPAEQKADK